VEDDYHITEFTIRYTAYTVYVGPEPIARDRRHIIAARAGGVPTNPLDRDKGRRDAHCEVRRSNRDIAS
jgi:hypothetical protein